MFRNRSVRLFLLATAMIPATATFGAFKMQGQIGQVTAPAQAAPVAAPAPAKKCSEEKVEMYIEAGTRANAVALANKTLKKECEKAGCDPDTSTITSLYFGNFGGLPVYVARGTEVVPGRQKPFVATQYLAKCKDKPLAAPAPVQPMPPAE